MISMNQALKPCKNCGGVPIIWHYMVGSRMKEYAIKCQTCGLELTYRVDTNGECVIGAPEIGWNYCLTENKSVIDVWNEINPAHKEIQNEQN